MTIEEEKEFRQKIQDTILPIAINMTEDQIKKSYYQLKKQIQIYLKVLEQCYLKK